MHPFTGLAWLLPLLLATLRLSGPLWLGLLLAGLLAALLLWPAARPRRKAWLWVMLPLGLGLLLVHGQWLNGWLGQPPASDRMAILQSALLLWLRVGTVLAGTLLWLSGTTPARLTRALLASRLPAGLAYLLASPLLLSEQLKSRLAAIIEAQTARGLDPRAGWWRRLGHLVSLAAPLISWTLADVSQRAAALESRAFRRQLHRTTLDAPASKLADRRLQQAAGLATIILAGSWLWH
jgi:energy-coupling factor transport system permease protein